MDVDARVEALEAQVARLKEHVRRLEEAMGMAVLTPAEWMLTPQQMRLVGALIARPMLTKDAAMAVLYRDLGKEEAEIKIVDVYVCNVRKKLRPFGIEIQTVWGQGYQLTAEHRAEAQRQIDAVSLAGVAA